MNIINSPAKRTALKLSTVGLFLPQNGVAEGNMHCGATDSSAQMPRPANMDTRKGNTGSGASSHARPTALVMKNELVNKNLPEDYENSGDSLPCTPEFHSDSEIELSGYSAEHEVLESDTRQLLSDFFKLFTGISQSKWKQRPALSTMKRVVDNLLEKHRYAYNGMINKLSLDDRGDDVSFISTVAKSIFEDGTTNWGRIASLIAFGAVVCQYLKTKGRESCVEQVGQEISSYLLMDQRDWLIRNNSWDGFVDFFRVEDPESAVRSTLMAVAGLAGIGATLAMLIR
ncbi:induced myeloid leukemia cell differentiation protein Mcl-1b [Boleophthalmus pectinirostris]|uniref:induced myeloid leukemia cell differentiation protein Mcl-1b n=1 Tax=Boleophthalmus pectinirostris TaxID=150288 RepID=UPI000A1C27C5|nr:induced myeloid leukemia cell differentiation protein Mcl-1b [Boleophthalmus pectinirostris]